MLHTLQVDMKSFPKSPLRHAISNGSSARDISKMSKRTSYRLPHHTGMEQMGHWEYLLICCGHHSCISVASCMWWSKHIRHTSATHTL